MEENILLNYGSEDDDDDDDNEAEFVPRAVRSLMQQDEDTTQESFDAGINPGHDMDLPYYGKVNGPTLLFDFVWQGLPVTAVKPKLRRERFTGKSGPLCDPISSPYEAFTMIWDRPIMEKIAEETNLYVQQFSEKIQGQRLVESKIRIDEWKNTDVNELYVYFAIILTIGFVNWKNISQYWNSGKNMFSAVGICVSMSFQRFQLLSRCLHFNNNNNLSEYLTPAQAKVFKIQPIVDHLNLKFSSLYTLGQHITIDETMTPKRVNNKKSKLVFNKTSSIGIRTYELFECWTGYLWRFEINTGSEINTENKIISGIIPNQVLQLLKGLENRGHTVWMSDYYNSPALARVLKTKGFDCVGTFRMNRQNVPEEFKSMNKNDMKLGQACGCTSGDVDLILWQEHSRVGLISTYHGLAVTQNKLSIITEYEICLKGIDEKDEILSKYPIARKKIRSWYKKFFRRLLNASIYNAYILYKHTHKKTTHRGFRISIINETLKIHQKDIQVDEMSCATEIKIEKNENKSETKRELNPTFDNEIIKRLKQEIDVSPDS